MNITENQANYITALAKQILAVDVSKLPTKAKAKVGFTFNPQANAIGSQKIAQEALDGLAKGEFGIDGRVFPSQIIDGLKIAARRAGC
jgi:hypothetical protein